MSLEFPTVQSIELFQTFQEISWKLLQRRISVTILRLSLSVYSLGTLWYITLPKRDLAIHIEEYKKQAWMINREFVLGQILGAYDKTITNHASFGTSLNKKTAMSLQRRKRGTQHQIHLLTVHSHKVKEKKSRTTVQLTCSLFLDHWWLKHELPLH